MIGSIQNDSIVVLYNQPITKPVHIGRWHTLSSVCQTRLLINISRIAQLTFVSLNLNDILANECAAAISHWLTRFGIRGSGSRSWVIQISCEWR